jgi:hypothetical protein
MLTSGSARDGFKHRLGIDYLHTNAEIYTYVDNELITYLISTRQKAPSIQKKTYVQGDPMIFEKIALDPPKITQKVPNHFLYIFKSIFLI